MLMPTTTEAPQKMSLKQHKEAIADYDKAIELNPKDADAYYNRGVAKAQAIQRSYCRLRQSHRAKPKRCKSLQQPRRSKRKAQATQRSYCRLRQSHRTKPKRCTSLQQPRTCLPRIRKKRRSRCRF